MASDKATDEEFNKMQKQAHSGTVTIMSIIGGLAITVWILAHITTGDPSILLPTSMIVFAACSLYIALVVKVSNVDARLTCLLEQGQEGVHKLEKKLTAKYRFLSIALGIALTILGVMVNQPWLYVNGSLLAVYAALFPIILKVELS